MKHPAKQELLDVCYGDAAAAVQAHTAECAECQAYVDQLKQTFKELDSYAVPERSQAYGQKVWERLASRLPVAKSPGWQLGGMRIRWGSWMLAPALAALLALAFAGGVWTEHRRTADSAKARERVLLLAMSDHLERSQTVLAELLHANADAPEFANERKRARDLIDENRLLRQSVMQSGNPSQAALLDDLERVLLEVANGSDQSSSGDLKTLQQRIESEGLLWKVRITGDDARERGQKL